MFKQIILPLLLVAAFIAGVGIFVKNSENIKLPGIPSPMPSISVQKTIKIDSNEISVEIADTQALRTKGLSGRLSLEENSGMLFIFDTEGGYSTQNITLVFWMKDMLIPIDIVWINDGKIVKIDANIEPPKEGTTDKDLLLYTPDQPVDYVLEVNAGFSAKKEIKVGDSVDLESAL